MGPIPDKAFQAEHAAGMKAQKMDQIFTISGTVKALDSEHNTAVVECPLSGQMFTLGGTLAPEADLEKGGKPAQLKDFTEGEHVNVKWQATQDGHLIVMLAAK